MYVPPIRGSEIMVWKADMPTNWIVLQARASVARLDEINGTEKVTLRNFGERCG